MKTYKLSQDDTLRPASNDLGVSEDIETRPLVAFGLFSAEGKLIGVKLPDDDRLDGGAAKADPPYILTSETDIAQANEEFLQRLAALPKLTPPEGKPFNPDNMPHSDLSEEEFEEFLGILESFRKPEPWSNPWDLA